MRVIFNPSLEPYFNLASEEYLLENCLDDCFMLWRNGKSVIIGKNQNAYSEVDLSFCDANGIKVVRRLTGGGAVFHDPGNINFSFVTDAKEEGINFLPYIDRICNALESFGICAAPNGRNDIESEGFKISGNAQCRYDTKDGRTRLLHHGTLLFSADMDSLSGALNASGEKLRSKGIKSVRSRVKNIRDMNAYSGPQGSEAFAKALLEGMYGLQREDLSKAEKKEIEKLAEKKYSRWEWNFGKSPEFSVTKKVRFPWGGIEISYCAKRGIIESIEIRGDFFATGDISELERSLIGVSLEPCELKKAFGDAKKYIHGAAGEDIAGVISGNCRDS